MNKIKCYIITVAMIIICSKSLQAQSTMNAIYELRGVREMAAGFEFTDGGKFNFYLSYGGLDRNATGTYTIINDTIKLKSDKVPASDFEVSHRKHENNTNGFVIKVEDKNTFIMSYTIAVAVINGQTFSYNCDSEGVINIDTSACEKIFLWNQLYGDIMTEVFDKEKNNASKNFIIVKMKPTLQQFTFAGVDLFVNANRLIFPANRLLNSEDLVFEKVK